MSDTTAGTIGGIAGFMIFGAVVGLFNWLFLDHPFQQFLRDLIVAVVALPIGIPVGLALNRNWQHRQDTQRRQQLLQSIRDTLKDNIELLGEIASSLTRDLGHVPTFTLNLGFLDATSELRSELLEIEILRPIEKARYELSHVSRRVDYMIAKVAALSVTVLGNPQKALQIQDTLSRYHETKRLAELMREKTSFTQFTLEQLTFSLSTIELAVGLKDVGADKSEAALGGAVHWCLQAITAIEKSLAVSAP